MAVEDRDHHRPDGFALVLALLAMMLLTFLGLTLAVTTSTELQIATNYRWSQQAFFNAEAGIEIGKRLLQTEKWGDLLLTARSSPLTKPTTTVNTRDWENAGCDTRGSIGYGAVFDSTAVGAVQDVSDVSTLGLAVPAALANLQGTFTLWVRRPLVAQTDGTLVDDTSDDDLILTSEGTAPYLGAATAFTGANRAVRTMEVRVARAALAACSGRGGQAGAGSGGAGFAACTGLTDDSLGNELEYAEGTGAAVGEGTQFGGE